MNIAIITASGRGTRMGEQFKETPKQYVEVEGKPLLFYCLETFEKNDDIDAIIIVTLEEYFDFVKENVEKFGITKFKGITVGGDSLKQSIMKGVEKAKETFAELTEEDIIVIHDGVRPLVVSSVISDAINTAIEKGPCLSGSPNFTGNFTVGEDMEVDKFYNKNLIWAGGTPMGVKVKDLDYAYKVGVERGILDDERYGTCFVSLLHNLGRKTYIVKDKERMNMKITTPADLDMFKAMMRRRKEEGLYIDNEQ